MMMIVLYLKSLSMMMIVLYLKSLSMVMTMKMFLIVLQSLSFYHDNLYHFRIWSTKFPTFVNIQPGPACKEPPANLSGTKPSCQVQGCDHFSIALSHRLVWISTEISGETKTKTTF